MGISYLISVLGSFIFIPIQCNTGTPSSISYHQALLRHFREAHVNNHEYTIYKYGVSLPNAVARPSSGE